MPRVKVAYWWNALNGGHEFGYECDSLKWLKSERRRICAPTRASSKAQKLRGLSPKYIVVDEMSPRFRQSKAAAARARSKNGRFKAHKPRSRRKA